MHRQGIALGVILVVFALAYAPQCTCEDILNNNSPNDTRAPPSLRDACLSIDRSVCVGRAKTPISIESTPENLVGHWKFDDRYGVDSSPSRNDVQGGTTPKVGAGFGARGYSAHCDEDVSVRIAHIDAYAAPQVTVAFWLFLVEDSTSAPGGGSGSWRTLVQKGDSGQHLTPAVMLWPRDNRLHVRVTTDYDWNENLDSLGAVLARRWTHVAVTLSHNTLQIYVNGVLDAQKILRGQIVPNSGPIYVGNSPWHAGAHFLIDDLRVYDKVLTRGEIAALGAQPALIAPGAVAALGCESCTYAKAVTSCASGYHLCSFPEVYAGAYHVARVQGWFRLNSLFWVRIDDDMDDGDGVSDSSEASSSYPDVLREEIYDPNIYKMAICCVDRDSY